MKFELGLCSVSFRKNTPQEILSAMTAAGLSRIEWGSDVHCPPEQAGEIAALQEQFCISCCSYGTYFRLGETPIDELEQYVEAAKRLGTRILRLWCGKKNSEEYSPEEKECLFASCRQAARLAEERDVILCMECHTRTYTNRKEAALELMREVASAHFRMYWQPNQFRLPSENAAYARAIAPYTENVHVFQWKEKERFPLREGLEEWREYLSYFEGEGVLLLEFMPDDSIHTLQEEAEALREIVK